MTNDFSNSDDFHPFGALIGLEFTEVTSGFSQSQIEVREEHFNPNGVVHGGVIYSMADTGMGAAVYTDLESDESCSTVEIKITYHQSVNSGLLTCKTHVLEQRSRLIFLESDVSNKGNRVAGATGTFTVH